MFFKTKTPKVAVLVVITLLALLASPAAAAKKPKKKMPSGTPVIWHERDAASLNLLAGPGGEQMRPDLRRVEFVKAEEGGYSPKMRVRDGAGREWVAKMGREAQSETAAVRLVWAAGYFTDINYLVPCVHIVGAPMPRKKVERCEGNGFANVRFEARPESLKRLDPWRWKQNPFLGTRELQGLKVLMALLNNWDMKDANNVVLYARDEGQLLYAISDLGATFGKQGAGFLWRITRSRNEPRDYANSTFIDSIKNGYVKFHFTGMNSGLLKKIRVEDARWVGGLLSRLSDAQLADAFRAADYTPRDVQTLTRVVRTRIDELRNLPRYAASETRAR